MMSGWKKFNGKYEKREYYIKMKNGEVLGPCWPNAGVFHPLNGKGEAIDGKQVCEIKEAV